ITELTEKPAWRDGLVALPASSVLESVLAHAGARPKERDAIDERIIAAVVAGVGTIIDSQDEVGGYPMPSATQRALDLPTANLEAWLATYSAQVE
ncbi:MAG TPA: right-handed parallel beta-helix repeat-containing protein, partial [Polyangiaceae bacterium]